jgi:hypothetical protein
VASSATTVVRRCHALRFMFFGISRCNCYCWGDGLRSAFRLRQRVERKGVKAIIVKIISSYAVREVMHNR